MRNVEDIFRFLGHEHPPVAASPDGSLWRSKITGSGPPSVAAVDGFMRLTLLTTLENEVATLYMGDCLPFDIDDLLQVDFYLKLSTATLPPSASVAFGLCSAYNDDPDALAAHASFRLFGNNNVVCESDDGVNDNDDEAAGLTLGTGVKRFAIDFCSGIKTVVPPPSVGGKAHVLFAMDDDRFNLRPVCRSVRFDMSSYTSGLQIYAQIQKGAASSVVATGVTPNLQIQEVRVRRKL